MVSGATLNTGGQGARGEMPPTLILHQDEPKARPTHFLEGPQED